MKRLLFLLAVFAPVLAFCDAPSDPVGAFRILLRGNSDTIVSLPLHRPALVEASIQTRTGNQLELSDDTPALPAEGAYVLIMSGSLEGAVLPITALNGRTLTVTPGSYDLTTLHTEAVDGLAEGAIAAVIPYWTLDTVFPSGSGIQATTSTLSPKSKILCFNPSSTGINNSISSSYIYFAGNVNNAAGWYRSGDMSLTRGDTPLPPNTYFWVRNPVGVDSELIIYGNIQMAGYRLPVLTRIANTDQDNLLAMPVPIPTTLAATGLAGSPAFTTTTSTLSPKDQLMVFDNTVVGQNKSVSATYIYFAGNGSITAGWYKTGNMTQSANAILLKPGEGLIIRKRSSASPLNTIWSAIPSYLQ